MKLLALFALIATIGGPIIESCAFLPNPQHWRCVAKDRGN